MTDQRDEKILRLSEDNHRLTVGNAKLVASNDALAKRVGELAARVLDEQDEVGLKQALANGLAADRDRLQSLNAGLTLDLETSQAMLAAANEKLGVADAELIALRQEVEDLGIALSDAEGDAPDGMTVAKACARIAELEAAAAKRDAPPAPYDLEVLAKLARKTWNARDWNEPVDRYDETWRTVVRVVTADLVAENERLRVDLDARRNASPAPHVADVEYAWGTEGELRIVATHGADTLPTSRKPWREVVGAMIADWPSASAAPIPGACHEVTESVVLDHAATTAELQEAQAVEARPELAVGQRWQLPECGSMTIIGIDDSKFHQVSMWWDDSDSYSGHGYWSRESFEHATYLGMAPAKEASRG